jgi:tripartite ATP-independent transporter DctM subunit
MASVAVAFAMAHTSVEKGHVAVSFVVNFFPKRAQAIVGTITSSFGFILFALLTWQSVVYAIHLRESQEVSLTLQLPFWPFVHGIAFSAVFSKMPVGFVMGFLGFLGFAYVVNLDAALGLLARDFFEIFSSYSLTVVPLFVLMGQVAFHSGISRRLYDSAYVVLGKRRGGLAMATVAACAGFSAISGSTNATAATMATVTLPEMRRYKYDMGLATGTVAAAGSLGILIPPSTIFIVYGILTEQSIGKLFLAGIFPGILLSILFILTIYLRVLKNPSLAPPGLETSMREKFKSFAGVLETLLIFGMVMGGIFFGIFSPTEAASAGAFLVILLAILRKQLTWKGFVQALADTTRISCMVMVIVAGAVVFGHFMAVTRIPYDLAGWGHDHADHSHLLPRGYHTRF